MTDDRLDPAALQRRIDELEERLRDREAVAEALGRMRDQVVQMRDTSDWSLVLDAFERELRGVVDCYSCGVNVLDIERDVQIDFYTTANGTERHERPGIPSVLRQVVDTGEPLYRRSRAQIDANGEPMRQEVQSVVDVPFGSGTLAVNHTRADAFTTRDIDVVSRFGRVVAEGLRRLQDLGELRDEIDRRRRNEERLAQAHRELQEAQDQLLETEALRVLVETAGGAAHELRQPLQALRLGFELLGASDALDADQLRLLQEQIDRMDQIIRGMATVREYRTTQFPGGRVVSFSQAED
jgi:hypothetical protein